MTLLKILIPLCMVACCTACNHIDDDRIPVSPVYVPFSSVGVWDLYGVSGAGTYRYFILSERQPADYSYTAMCATGYGGVLLISDIHGNPVAYDLSCPVECKPTTRVRVDADAMVAECPVCHSVYDVVTNYGYPLSGVAAEKGYGLQRYYVAPSTPTLYRLITR